jgi:hypothetical protein
VLVADVGGQHLIDTASRLVDEPLGGQGFSTLGERRTVPNNIRRHN